jgi:hypothetical protein
VIFPENYTPLANAREIMALAICRASTIIPVMQPDKLPDFHFLLVAPNLGAEWVFDAARNYWLRFRPTIISDFELLRIIPPEYSISVTVLTRRDMVPRFGVNLAQIAPQALFDPVAYDFFDDARLALDGRAELGQPFGVPLSATDIPTMTPSETGVPITDTPRDAIEATVGPIATDGPSPTPTSSGFVTQTPTPESADQTAQPETTETPRDPIYPTPGPITGS